MQSYITNQRTPYTIRPSVGRSDFQTNHIMSIAQRDDFDYFVAEQHCDKPYKGPFMCLWYDKSDKLHGEWVGRNRVLQSVVGQ